jgi:hypothetical protein
MTRDGSVALFEIHKIAHKGWFGRKAYWVVQLYSQLPSGDVVKMGCVSEKVLAYAISSAEHDLKDGFISICDFGQAAAQD